MHRAEATHLTILDHLPSPYRGHSTVTLGSGSGRTSASLTADFALHKPSFRDRRTCPVVVVNRQGCFNGLLAWFLAGRVTSAQCIFSCQSSLGTPGCGDAPQATRKAGEESNLLPPLSPGVPRRGLPPDKHQSSPIWQGCQVMQPGTLQVSGSAPPDYGSSGSHRDRGEGGATRTHASRLPHDARAGASGAGASR